MVWSEVGMGWWLGWGGVVVRVGGVEWGWSEVGWSEVGCVEWGRVVEWHGNEVAVWWWGTHMNLCVHVCTLYVCACVYVYMCLCVCMYMHVCVYTDLKVFFCASSYEPSDH